MLLRVLDFETTGTPPDAAVCEVGWTDVQMHSGDATIGAPQAMLVNPNRPMPPEARAVHHISDDDLDGAPPITTGFLALGKGSPDYYVAHNAEFERHFFAGGNATWICTMKAARRAWADLPGFSNQFLRYHLGIDELALNFDRDLAMPPHRAGPDTYVTAHILTALLKVATPAQLAEWTRMPVHYPRVPMTKHRGKLWSEVDTGLLRWFLNADVEKDVKVAARAELDRRSGGY